MKSKALFAAVGALAVFAVAGCGDRAAENAAPGGEGVAESAGRAVDQAGQEVKQDTKEAVQATGQAAQNAGQAVENTAEHAGEAVGGAVQDAGKAVGNAAQGAAKETQDAAQVLLLTPKVKNALIADKQINARNLNVDTSGEANTLTITGSVPSTAAKQRVSQVAKQALGDAASKMKVVNNVTVAQ